MPLRRRLCLFALLSAIALFATTGYSQVKVAQQGDKIAISIDGKPYSDFYLSSPKLYLHPLRSVSGKIVSRMHPMSEREGELKDHQHHRGLWYGHGDVNGIDFWANEASYAPRVKNLGVQKLVKVLDTRSGKNEGSLRVSLVWNDPEGKTLLEETREIVLRKAGGTIVIDTDLTLKAVTEAKFGDTKEGVFALRTAPEFELAGRPRTPATPARSGRMINANGVEGKAIWGKRAPWVDYSAMLDGEKVGIAILDHPKNPRHPTYWHAREYGLFAVNPFGVHDFENDKTKDGSMTLKPGETMRFRYRMVIHPGDEKDANVQKMFDDYARKAS